MSEQPLQKNTQKFVSSREAAKRFGVTHDYIARLCRKGQLTGNFDNGKWLVDMASLESFFVSRGPKLPEAAGVTGSYLTAKQAARMYRVTNDYIARLCKQGKLVAKRADRTWLVEQSSLNTFFAERAAYVESPNVSETVYAPQQPVRSVVSPQPVASSIVTRTPRYVYVVAAVVGVMMLGASALGVSRVGSGNAQVAGVWSGFAQTVRYFFFGPEAIPVQPVFTSTIHTYGTSTTTKAQTITTKTPTIIEQKTYPVTERIVERLVTQTVSGVSQTYLDQQLNALRSQIAGISSGSSGAVIPYAPALRIDKLSSVAITGGSISGASISGGSLSNVSLSTGDLSGVVSITNGGTGTSSAPTYGQLLLGNAAGTYDLVATSSLGIVGSGGSGSSFGQGWEIVGGYLAPTSTIGIIVAASSTIGSGTAAGGLTVSGGATTTGSLVVQGTNVTAPAFNASGASTTVLSYNGQQIFKQSPSYASVFIGDGTGTLTVDSQYDIALGSRALSSITTGDQNIAIGESSLAALTTGSSNLSIGIYAGENLLSGSQNILVGDSAGNAITTGYGNTFLGFSSGSNLTTGGNSVAIGNRAHLASTTAWNQLNIGNLLFGTLPATSTAFRLPTSGSLGVGTSSPFAKFSIQSNNGDTATTLFAIGSSTANATSTLFSVSNIGSTTLFQISSSLLKTDGNGTIIAAVAGTDYTNFGYLFPSNATTTQLTFNGGVTFAGATSTASFAVTGSTTVSSVFNVGGQFNANLSAIIASTTLTGNSLFINATTTSFAISGISSGNLLKTTTGGALVAAVAGTDYTTFGYLFPSNATSTTLSFNNGFVSAASSTIVDGIASLQVSASGGSVVNWNGYRLNLASNSYLNLAGASPYIESSDQDSVLQLRADGSSGAVTITTASTERFRVTGSGNVGIGTTSPYRQLSVGNGAIFGGDVLAGSFTATSSAFLASTTLSGNTLLTSATTTSFAVSGISSGNLLKTTTGGALVAAVAGTDYATPATVASAYPFALTGNATSTLTQFNGGLTAYASSTIGAGGQATGLTISGGATTTGMLTLGSSINFVGGQSTSTLLSIAGVTYFGASSTLSSVYLGSGAGITPLRSGTGTGNFGVGAAVLASNTSGLGNNALGFYSLNSNISGSNNNALGASSLFNNTSGSNNNAFGVSSLTTNTSGSGNNAIGYNALLINSTGSNNNALGFQAGYNITTGYSNTLIGDNTSVSGGISTGDGNIGLGSNIFFPSVTGDRQLNIGNLIYGIVPATTTTFALPTTGSIGIGTSSPFAKFSIAANNGDTATTLFAIGSSTASATTTLFSVSNTGSTTIANGVNITAGCFAVSGTCLSTGGSLTGTQGQLAYFSGTNTAVGTSSLFLTVSGNVGIGTTSPVVPLQIEAHDAVARYYDIGAAMSATRPGWQVGPIAADFAIGSFASWSTAASAISPQLTILGANGNVGISSTTPFARLSVDTSSLAAGVPSFVVGSSTKTDLMLDQNSTLGLGTSTVSGWSAHNFVLEGNTTALFFGRVGDLHSASNAYNDSSGWKYRGTGTAANSYLYNGQFNFRNAASGAKDAAITWVDRFNITAAGNVGIGTSTPFSKFSIHAYSGDTNTTLFAIGSSTASATTTHFVVTNTGNVGIGTTTPAQALSVVGRVYTTSGIQFPDGTVQSSAAAGASSGTQGQFAYYASNGTTVSGTSTFSISTAGNVSVAAGKAYQYNSVNIATASTTLGNFFFGNAGNLTSITNAAGQNTAVGSSSLAQLSTGFWNSSLGVYSLFSNTTGNYNNAVGYQALYSANANSNNAFGAFALASTTSGTENTGFGGQTLGRNTTGSYNVAVGNNAVFNNIAGSKNTGVGYLSLYTGTTGDNNAAFGYASMFNGTGSNGNTALGANSLYYATGDHNTAVGYNSGLFLTTGYGNTLAGRFAGGSITTGSNNIALGYYSYLPSTTGNNQLNIGNILFGTIPATTTTTGPGDLLTFPTTGSIGIGSTSPFSKFAIHTNNGDTENILFAIGSSTASATTTHLVVTNVGSVGIGTTTPWGTLSVTNTGSGPSFVVEDASSPDTTQFQIDADGQMFFARTATTSLHSSWSQFLMGLRGNLITEKVGGNGLAGTSLADNTIVKSATGDYGYLTTAAASKITQDGGVITFGYAASGSAGASLTFTESMRISATGNLGLGTASPTLGKLQISKDSTYNSEGTGGIYLQGAASDSTLILGADATNDFAYVQAMQSGTSFTTRPLGLQPNGGKVGVGTTSPWKTLSVTGTLAVTALPSIGAGTYLPVCYDTTTGEFLRSTAVNTCDGADGDIAEQYGSEESVVRGQIVSLGSSVASRDFLIKNRAPGEAASSTYTISTAKVRLARATDRSQIIGAVPTAPFTIGSDVIDPADNPVKVALVGHVPVTMTLDGGDVAIGDPITVSDTTPGAGMKATTSGRILGYALEPYSATATSSDGMIEVYINPQDWLAPQNVATLTSLSATTTHEVLVQSSFVTATDALKSAISSAFTTVEGVAQSGVRMLGKAVYATIGTFNYVFADHIIATDITADLVTATQKLCVGTTCVTEEQLQQLLNIQTAQASGGAGGSTETPPPAPEVTPAPDTTSSTAPVEEPAPAEATAPVTQEPAPTEPTPASQEPSSTPPAEPSA